MKALLFIFKFFLITASLSTIIPTEAFAQNSKIEILRNRLQTETTDTGKIATLRKLSAAFTAVDPTIKMQYARDYLALAEKNQIDSTIANAYLDIGIAFAVKSHLDSGLRYFRLGEQKSKEINYLPGLARSYVNIGFLLDRLENKKESVKYYEKSLKIFRGLNHQRGINQCITNLGSLYFDIGEYKTADIYFRQVLQNVEKTPSDQTGLATAYFSLGGSNRRLGKPLISLDYYRKSLAIREQLNDINGMALSNWGIGLIKHQLGDYKTADQHYKIAVKYNLQTKNIYQEAVVLTAMAENYLELKDFKNAEETAKKAVIKSKEAKSEGLENQALETLAKVQTAIKKTTEALATAQEIAKIEGNLNTQNVKKEVILRDLHRINADNESLEKDNQIKSKTVTKLGLAVAIISVLLAVVIVLLIMYYRWNREKKTTNKLLSLQKQKIAEVVDQLTSVNEELKSQMELVSAQNAELDKVNNIKNKFFSIVSHDLKAPIHSLKAIFDMYQSGVLTESEIKDLMNKLAGTVYTTASFLDNLLEWSKRQLEGIVVSPQHTNLQDIVAHNIKLLQSQIHIKNIKVINNLPTDTTAYVDTNMIHVVFRNLLSNAVKFCSAGDQVIFEAKIDGDNITCLVKDTGQGISELDQQNLYNLTHVPGTGTMGEKGHHIGLILCRDMVLQNKGTISFKSEVGKGTEFYITLPLKAE